MASEKLDNCPWCKSTNIEVRANCCFCADCGATGPEHYVGSYSGNLGEKHRMEAIAADPATQQLAEAQAEVERHKTNRALDLASLSVAYAQLAQAKDELRVMLGHMTGGMEGDWRDVDPVDFMRDTLKRLEAKDG